MQKINLNGPWTLHPAKSPETTCPATVPGCVHTDLMTAGLLPDPWYRDNEKDLRWVETKDWVYTRTFEITADLLKSSRHVLQFEGLDTLCTLELNGHPLGETDNMHRTWEFEVHGFLKEGNNTLTLTFHSPLDKMRAEDAVKHLPGWNLYHEDYRGKSYVRKMACAFGWDWGLMAPTAGIWRNVSLLAFENRIESLRIQQDHSQPGRVQLRVSGNLSSPASGHLHILLDGDLIHEQPFTETDSIDITVPIPEPRLWWPNGMGEQPLYEILLELDCGDRVRKRIGLRELKLIRKPDAHGESFRFNVNGRDIFMKGGNWIPCDIFPSRVAPDTYRHLLRSCADAHMNMIRVWGGGIYEDDLFYDLCDELGLLVWQDFMFACSTYPTFDPAFMDNVREEASDAVRRLRHHPCLALWCGNNELEQGLVRFDIDDWTETAMPPQAYTPLFDELLPDVVAREDGATPYWPCSPHSPNGDRNHFNNPACGDAHAWSVWFGGEPMEAQREWGFRFMSEFGFQSYPELKTLEACTLPEDRSIGHWMLDYHQRSPKGNLTIFTYLLDRFRAPASFEATLILSQITQALCIQIAADHARRIQGQMDGLLYWQINDLWPGATWSSIDVFGRWKALHFFAKAFFAPVRVSLLERPETDRMELHVSNHLPVTFHGTLHWRVTTCAGETLEQGEQPVAVPSQSNRRITELDCATHRDRGGSTPMPIEIRSVKHIPREGDRDLLVWGRVTDASGREVSRGFEAFCKPRYWNLTPPEITCDITPHAEGFQIELKTNVCAPWTHLSLKDTEARFSKNYLNLLPGEPETLICTPQTPLDEHSLKARLNIIPLVSLFA